MVPGLWTHGAVGAFLIAFTWPAMAATPPASDAASLAAEPEASADNGVHAAPSGHVAVALLAPAPGMRTSPLVSRRARTVSWRTRRSERARLIRVSDTVPASQAPAPARLVSTHRLVVDVPHVVLEPSRLEDDDTSAAPEAAPIALAQADSAPIELLPAPAAEQTQPLAPQPAVLADDAEERADVHQDGDQQSAGAAPSEEAAVYRRPVQASPDEPAAAALAATPIRDERDQPSQPHVAFPRRSAEAAAVFDSYMHAVAAIDAGFKDGRGIARALKTASAYDPGQLEEGMVAYGAMAALQSPRFVYAVMDAAADPDQRRSIIDALLADPQSAARLPGADVAAALASAAILHEAQPVTATGRALKQAAYDVQHQDWSIAKPADQDSRLAAVKMASGLRLGTADADMARLLAQLSKGQAGAGGGPRGMSEVAAHSLALAALAILGGADEGDARLEPVVSEHDSAQCLKLSKLSLFECLAVAGPEYEDLYCLAQHAVTDTGQCVAGAAGAADGAPLESVDPRLSRRADLR